MLNNKLYVDIHVVETVPPSCINRDDAGSPKTAVYGGTVRARVSSQCWKKAVRTMFADILPAEMIGKRTLFVPDLIAEAIRARNPALDADKLARNLLEAAGVKTKADKSVEDETKENKGEIKTDALFFISQSQIDALADLAVKNPDGIFGDKEKKGKNKGNKKNAAKAYAGGIVGIAGATDVYIRNCYNSAAVLNADANGGVVGYYINEDENTDNIRYLRNNYYLNENASAGIGLIEDDSDRKASRAAAGISSTSMSGLASSLTEAYKDDLGIYGNNGYPVLQWQTAVDDDQRVYMNEISKEVQDKLDKYNMKSSGTSQYGQIILNFFTPGNYTNDAMLQYNGSKDDIKAKVRNAE